MKRTVKTGNRNGLFRFLAVIILTLGLMAAAPGPARADSAPFTYCYSPNNQNCVSQWGYTGQSPWGYPVDAYKNNCTNYASFRLNQNGYLNPGNLGNASSWATNARLKGLTVKPGTSRPEVGDVAQWNYGHVAYVEWVSADGSQFAISETGWGPLNGYPSMSGRGIFGGGGKHNESAWPDNFIHFKGGNTPPPAPADADGDGIPDASDKCPNAAGPSGNNGCPYIDPRVFLPSKYGPVECGRAGGDTAQSLICNLWRKGKWVSIASPRGDWGYGYTRGWIANRDGTISHCAAVGTGNQLRCDTFTGYRWTTRVSPATDLGYLSAVDGRTFLATKYGPAECGRADSETSQRLVCNLWRKGKWVSITSPLVEWGYSERAWVTNRDGTVSHCAQVHGTQLRCDTFTGYRWTTHTSPATDLGYQSDVDGRVFLATKYGPAECGRAGGDTAQSLVCNLWRKGTFRSISSPVGVWGAFDSAGWIANRDGTVSRCAVSNNLLRCDTFTGYKWTTRTSPWADLGYQSAVDGRTFRATKYGPAECGRAGGDTAQNLVCNVWRKGKFRSISSPLGAWGDAASQGWIANRDGTISRCTAIGGNQLRCDTFTGYRWTSRTSPWADLGYKS